MQPEGSALATPIDSGDPTMTTLATTLDRHAPPPVTRSGRGLLVAGGIIGGGALVARTVFSGILRASIGPEGDIFPVVAPVLGVVGLYTLPFVGAGLGLVFGGMYRRGRFKADRHLFRGAPEPRVARRVGLGWGLFAGGVSLWIATRLAGFACDRELCSFRVWEGGYFSSLAMTATGLSLATWSMGYRRYERDWSERMRSLSVAPMSLRGGSGLSISGRF